MHAAPHHIALLCQIPKAGANPNRGPVKRVPADEEDTAVWLLEAGLIAPCTEDARSFRRTRLGDVVVRDCMICVDAIVAARHARLL